MFYTRELVRLREKSSSCNYYHLFSCANQVAEISEPGYINFKNSNFPINLKSKIWRASKTKSVNLSKYLLFHLQKGFFATSEDVKSQTSA